MTAATPPSRSLSWVPVAVITGIIAFGITLTANLLFLLLEAVLGGLVGAATRPVPR